MAYLGPNFYLRGYQEDLKEIPLLGESKPFLGIVMIGEIAELLLNIVRKQRVFV